jgi:hypothetical protein
MGVVVAGICIGVLCLARYPERQNQRRAELAAHADYEHAMWMHGDPRGFYGRFPPAI